MGKLPEQFVNQVQQATDIVDLVGQFVAIKQRGKDYQGLCPFHREKTPSFYVSPAKQIFKCFGCGAGGGVYQFIILQQKCTFPEAVRLLAERANIPMPRMSGDDSTQAGQDRGELQRVMRFATEFFQRQLRAPIGKEALEYARKRGLTEDGLERFELGYSPLAWDSLILAARGAGYSPSQLIACGLAIEKDSGGCYDRFRNRLMFPIIDQAGRVIAFGGRALAMDEKAKYINSPETILFDKSSNLYGLSWARQSISESGQAVVVEGYFDALLPAQAGVANVVATLGTALTERHVRTLSRLATDLVLIFDADAAGLAAAERGMEIFITQQVNVRIAAVPDGKDPADYVLAHGGEAFAKVIAEAPEALEHLWQRRWGKLSGSGNLVVKRRAADEFLRAVVNSSAYGAIDPVRQGLLINRLAHLLDVPSEQLQRSIRQLIRQVGTAASAKPAVSSGKEAQEPVVGTAAAQRRVLEVLICQPDLFDEAARHIGLEDFSAPGLADVARELWRLAEAGQLELQTLLYARGDAAWGQVITDLAAAGDARGNFQQTLAGDVEMLTAAARQQNLGELRKSGDDESLRALTEALKARDQRKRPW